MVCNVPQSDVVTLSKKEKKGGVYYGFISLYSSSSFFFLFCKHAEPLSGTIGNHSDFPGNRRVSGLHRSDSPQRLPVGECSLAFRTASVMFRNVLGRLVTGTTRAHRYAKSAPVNQGTTVTSVWARGLSDVTDEVSEPFDTFLLEVLVCPLSKKRLR